MGPLQFVGTPENSAPWFAPNVHVRIPTACSELQRERKESLMTYSIIGSGAIGSALAGHFASKGIEVSLATTADRRR